MLCRNPLVAERQEDISQPQGGWFGRVEKPCPERTEESAGFPVSLQDTIAPLQLPATPWLANFHRRFATKERFLQSTSNIKLQQRRLRFGASDLVLLWNLELGIWNFTFLSDDPQTPKAP